MWGPVGVARIAAGDPSAGIAILIISFVLVSGVDNLLRPLLLTVRIKIHPLLVFFSIMGGLQLFGLNGLILGPMMLMLFFTGVDLFDQADGPGKSLSDPVSGAVKHRRWGWARRIPDLRDLHRLRRRKDRLRGCRALTDAVSPGAS